MKKIKTVSLLICIFLLSSACTKPSFPQTGPAIISSQVSLVSTGDIPITPLSGQPEIRNTYQFPIEDLRYTIQKVFAFVRLKSIWERSTSPTDASQILQSPEVQTYLIPENPEYQAIRQNYQNALQRAQMILQTEFWAHGWVEPETRRYQFRERWKQCLAEEISQIFYSGLRQLIPYSERMHQVRSLNEPLSTEDRLTEILADITMRSEEACTGYANQDIEEMISNYARLGQNPSDLQLEETILREAGRIVNQYL